MIHLLFLCLLVAANISGTIVLGLIIETAENLNRSIQHPNLMYLQDVLTYTKEMTKYPEKTNIRPISWTSSEHQPGFCFPGGACRRPRKFRERRIATCAAEDCF